MSRIQTVISQFLVISLITTDRNLFPVDRCRKIAKKSKVYDAYLGSDPISLALKEEWTWIQARAQVGTINRVDERANEALGDIRERIAGIVATLQEAAPATAGDAGE